MDHRKPRILTRCHWYRELGAVAGDGEGAGKVLHVRFFGRCSRFTETFQVHWNNGFQLWSIYYVSYQKLLWKRGGGRKKKRKRRRQEVEDKEEEEGVMILEWGEVEEPSLSLHLPGSAASLAETSSYCWDSILLSTVAESCGSQWEGRFPIFGTATKTSALSVSLHHYYLFSPQH